MTLAALPLGDWQFWCASAVAAAALFLLLRPLLRRRKSAACPGCPSGAAALRSKRTSLTLGGKRIS